MEIKILYEDKNMLICLKPVGVATQTSRPADQDMVSLMKNYLARQEALKDPYLGVIHRLDQPVSGILVFTKTKQAAASLSKQEMNKEYLALCYGMPPEEEKTLIHYLKKDGHLATITDEWDKEGKRAELTYRMEEKRENSAVLRIWLKTGRFHQIRAQLSAIGHPLLGDRKYSLPESEAESRCRGINSVALCACGLGIIHPITKEKMKFTLDREDLPLWYSEETAR